MAPTNKRKASNAPQFWVTEGEYIESLSKFMTVA